MNAELRWARRAANSAHNFDLVLINPQDIDSNRIRSLFEAILQETHRGLTLSSQAAKEFQRWINSPATPLKSSAYVLLSNWFLTQSGDRNSMVATCCETLWDELFPCRPVERLSSPEAGRNHVMIPSEFAKFWQRVLNAQAADERDGLASDVNVIPSSQANHVRGNLERSPTGDLSEANACSASDRLRAMFDNNGLHFEVEGSPRALADFLEVYGRTTARPEESK